MRHNPTLSLSGLAGLVLALCSLPVSAQQMARIIAVPSTVTRSTQGAQCPNQGGILDSISVPVNQPITLYVYVSYPTQQDEPFQVASLNPAIAAAGDPTQAFAPIVTIPAGQQTSNAFTLYGISVGQTILQLVSLTGDYGTSDTPTTAWDVDQGFLDANPPTSNTCRNGSQPSTDPNVLSTCGTPISGVASDGVTQLLMRAEAGLAGTACFQITTNDGLDDGQIANQVLTTQGVGSLDEAFSFYQSPAAFGSSDSYRTVNVQFSFTPSYGNGNTSSYSLPVTIVRPPVMLLHGLWSDPSAWANFPHQEDAYHTYNPASYKATNASNFSVNAPSVPGFVADTLNQFRQKGYAGTQADVIAHSMGGILTRMYVNSPQFQQPQNYDKGDVRRLVTLDTPHSGSSFANLLAGLHQSRPTAISLATRPIGSITQGAVCDLAENSPAIQTDLASSPTNVPARTVSADGGPIGKYLGPFQLLLTANVCALRVAGVCVYRIYLFPQDKVNGFAFTQENDAIVAKSSQQGGLFDGPDYPSFLHFGISVFGFNLATGVVSPTVATDVFNLLDGPQSNFDASVPPAQSDGSGTPITVPGVPATNASDYASQCGPNGPMNPGGLLKRVADEPAAAADPRVNITAPTAGQQFHAGDNITITVQVDASLNAGSVLLSLSGVGDLIASPNGSGPFQASTTIPATFAGPLTITPLAVTAVGNKPVFLQGASVTVNVSKAAAPTSIALARQYFYISPTTTSESLDLTGYYADGSQVNLTSSVSGTSYRSSNPKVATVNSEGAVRILAAGTAVITASNSGLRAFAVFVVQNPAAPLPPADVTGQLSLQLSGFTLNRNTGFFVQTATILNAGAVPVPGPLYLVFQGLPSGVNLIQPTGTTQIAAPGSPYLKVPMPTAGLTIAPGQSVQFTLQFLDPSRVRITYTPHVFQSLTTP